MLSLPHQVVMRIKGDKVDELLKGYIRHQGSLFIDKDILWIPFLTSVRAALWWEVPWTGRGGLESFLPCSLLCAAFGSNPFTLLVPRGLIFKRGLDLDEWSECGHRTSSISITWKLAGNADFQSQLGAISCLIGREELGVLQGVHWARRREKWTPRGLSLASLEVRTDENCLGLHLPSQFQLWGCFSGPWKLIEREQNVQTREVPGHPPLFSPPPLMVVIVTQHQLTFLRLRKHIHKGDHSLCQVDWREMGTE